MGQWRTKLQRKILKPLFNIGFRIYFVEIIAPHILYLLRFHWIFAWFSKVLKISKLGAFLAPLWSNKVQ